MKIIAYTMDGNKVDVNYKSHELTHCLKKIIGKVEKNGYGRVYQINFDVL